MLVKLYKLIKKKPPANAEGFNLNLITIKPKMVLSINQNNSKKFDTCGII